MRQAFNSRMFLMDVSYFGVVAKLVPFSSVRSLKPYAKNTTSTTSTSDMTVSRKKHDTTPVAEAAELAHGLLGEDDAKPVSETRADWIEVLAARPARDSRHLFSPAVGNLVCERTSDRGNRGDPSANQFGR